MNKEIPSSGPSDEVDLGHVFNAIGRLFDKFFSFIAKVFRYIFSMIIYVFKAIIENFKIIATVMIVSAILGLALESMLPKTYSSSMLIRPYFDSQYQVVNNIKYYNTLISDKDYDMLSGIFRIAPDEVKKLVYFDIDYGPETKNEQIVQYDQFKKTLDSTTASKIEFDDFIKNRSIYSASIYEIEVLAKQKDIFAKLGEGFNNSLSNVYSEMKMQKRDSTIALQKENILEQIRQIDSLQAIYINVLNAESKNSKSEISFGSEGISMNKEKSNTKEFELLTQEIDLRNQLRALDQQKVENDALFDVISDFQKVGSVEKRLLYRFSLLLPALAFVIMCLIYLVMRAVKYVKSYED